MQWYYADGNTRLGPVTDEEFQSLISRGTVHGDTLVWCNTMPDWALLSTIGNTPAIASALGSAASFAQPQIVCVECGRAKPADQVVEVAGHDVCINCKDHAIDKMRLRMPIGRTAWRDGKKMVVAESAQLPDLCVTCGKHAGGGRVKRKYYWHTPFLYVTILTGVLIYLVLALCLRKSVTTELGFCDPCRSRRNWDLVIGWLSFFGGIGICIAGAANEADWGWSGLLVFLFGVVWLIVRTQLLRATRIRDGYAWLQGCHKDYLDRLPTWTGQ